MPAKAILQHAKLWTSGRATASIAKVFAFAVEIFHGKEKAREFLTRPHMMLDSKPLLDVALATGADLLMNLLGRAAYGGGV